MTGCVRARRRQRARRCSNLSANHSAGVLIWRLSVGRGRGIRTPGPQSGVARSAFKAHSDFSRFVPELIFFEVSPIVRTISEGHLARKGSTGLMTALLPLIR
jgi:hypothetical protein